MRGWSDFNLPPGVYESNEHINPRDDEDNEIELSPRPWRISESKVPGYSRIISIVDANDTVVCDMVGAGSSNEKVLATVRATAKAIVETMNGQ